jgi:hypothetical protein
LLISARGEGEKTKKENKQKPEMKKKEQAGGHFGPESILGWGWAVPCCRHVLPFGTAKKSKRQQSIYHGVINQQRQ